MNALPTMTEARQLLRLRGLRVQRERDAVAAAHAAVSQAAEAVRVRQRCIELDRVALQQLAHDIVHSRATQLPRWAETMAAQREYLADQLERDEYALIDEEHELEQAEEKLQQARAALTRALAREDAVRGLADQTRRARSAVREQRAEVELEDQSRFGVRPLQELAS
jgi:hypothetical protein